MHSLPQPLAALAAYKQFILWKIIIRDNTSTKVPIDYKTLQISNAHDPNIWTNISTIINYANLYGDEYSIGFVLTQTDPFFFVDIDKCLQDNGQWSPIAMDVLAHLPGAAVEVSQSGCGLHIIGKGKLSNHSCKNTALGLELYTESRFVALTGTNAIGSAETNCTAMAETLIAKYFTPKTTVKNQSWTNKPISEWNGYTDDKTLIEKALNTKSVSGTFGDKAIFADLWNANQTVLIDNYPSENNPYDASSADAALAQHLAFWTGNDCDRILRLMWLSKLVRDKWNRPDYLIRTITHAVSMQTVVYTAGGDAEPILKLKGTPGQIEWANKIVVAYNDDRILQMRGPALKAAFWIDNQGKTIDELITSITPIESATNPLNKTTKPEIVEGYQFLGVTQQIEYFTNCVYVQDIHKIFTPAGTLLKSDQFNATYGGYIFQLDSTGNGKTTKKAWEAFTESQAIRYPKAEATCFRPDLESAQLIQDEGRTLVNIYVPINTPRKQGDPTPFLNHLIKVLPDERDRSILLAYMAACIQYKGVKFQWAPLIQGVEGNGKTLFTKCVAFAIGERYTHMPPAEQISEKFNSWLFNKLLIGVEDIYVPDHKLELMEILKPMITADRYAERAMGVSQIMRWICCNFIFNTNHKDGLRKTINDRRIGVFYSAQQVKSDLKRDGMTGNYFPQLYDWLKADGYAIVANYLENYSIPDELNPAHYHNAPDTSSTNEAIQLSLGNIEQEIMEAAEEGCPGFAGGWISSIALEKLLQGLRATRMIPHNKRRGVLQSLGYDWHPALRDGRVNNFVPFDNGKPRLFIKDGHIHINLTKAADVAKAYQEAQMGSFTVKDAREVFTR